MGRTSRGRSTRKQARSKDASVTLRRTARRVDASKAELLGYRAANELEKIALVKTAYGYDSKIEAGVVGEM